MDRISKGHRSWNMSRIKSGNTKPEIVVRSLLHNMGYRFRLHRKDLPGKPDIVLPRYKSVIFVHGCFWHRHKGCKNATSPKTKKIFLRLKTILVAGWTFWDDQRKVMTNNNKESIWAVIWKLRDFDRIINNMAENIAWTQEAMIYQCCKECTACLKPASTLGRYMR